VNTALLTQKSIQVIYLLYQPFNGDRIQQSKVLKNGEKNKMKNIYTNPKMQALPNAFGI